MVMKSLNRPISLLLLALLSACAGGRAPTLNAASASSSASAPIGVTPKATAEADSDARQRELTPELLFGVLASEIAAQRGAVGSAALTDLDLAKQTHDPRLAEWATQFALASGNLRTAAESLQLWLQLEPNSSRAREQLVLVSLRTGQMTKSLPLIQNLLRQQPDQAQEVFLQMGRMLELQPDQAAAARMVRALAPAYPDLPAAHFALLASAAALDDSAAQTSELDRLAQLAPQWDFPVAWQAERLRKVNPDAALVFLQKELARRPQAGLELRMAYPRLLVSARRFVEARQRFEALLAEHPRQPDLLYASGLLAFQLNDLDVARRELQSALDEHYPDADFLRYSLGQLAEAQHDEPGARKWYLQVQAGAQYLPAQVRLAFIESESGSLDAGMARLSKLGSNDAERVQLVLVQSELAREAKRYDRSLAVLNQALRHYPRTPELLYERALVFDMLKQPVNAERDLHQLLKLRPNDEQALNALGYILANRTTRYPEAYGLISKALKLAPDNPMILDSMGWVLFKLGRGNEALGYLNRAYSALPDQEVAAHYVEVLWTLGRQAEARALWTKALQSPDEHPQLDETMRRLNLK